MEPIRVLIVDDISETRNNIRRMLSFDQGIEVIGEGRDGQEAVQKALSLKPHVVLMDVNMPRLDGIAATERISLELPGCSVIMVSVQGEQEYLRRAMLAGARDYLVKPFGSDELVNTVRSVYELESKRSNRVEEKAAPKRKPQVITVFGSKGGVGKTTLAVNLAVLLAKTKKKVALVDLDLQFGDVSVFLNLLPKRTISELAQEGSELDMELVESYLMPHISGIKVLPAPGRPEYAELITPRHVEEVVKLLKSAYDYIVIDTSPHFNETNLTALDLSTQILLMLSMDLATIKNVKLSLELLESLHQKGKTKLIINRASEELGIRSGDVEQTLDFLIAAQIPSDGKLVISALNKGIPFVFSSPNAKVSLAIKNIANMVIEDRGYQNDLRAARSRTFLSRLFK